MALEKLIVPQMGESINEVQLIKLYKKVGDLIKAGETIADVATDKVDTELTSAVTGIIQHIFYTKGKQIIPIGEVFANIETNVKSVNANVTTAPTILNENNNLSTLKTISRTHHIQIISPQKTETLKTEKNINNTSPQAIFIKPTTNKINNNKTHLSEAKQSNVAYSHSQVQKPLHKNIIVSQVVSISTDTNFYFSPVVNKLILDHAISSTEIKSIPGTGEKNRITKHDILNYLQHRTEPKTTTNKNHSSDSSATIPTNKSYQSYILIPEGQTLTIPNQCSSFNTISDHIDRDDLVPIERKRETIISHLLKSKNDNVHATLIAEADVSNIVYWREKNKKTIEETYQTKLTYTPIIVEAIATVLKNYPLINNVIIDNKILERSQINIGIATALDDGNLIVPIIKNADNLGLLDLAQQTNLLVNKARANELAYTDIDGGTFTLTNIGTFNGLIGTPILPPNQSGILATGAITKKIVVRSTAQGNELIPTHMMYLSLGFDHRIIDGIIAGKFLNEVSEKLSNFDIDRQI